MPWTVTIALDADKPDVGTATATWQDGDATPYTYSRRIKVSLAEGKAFAAEAKAGRLAVASRQTKQTTLEQTLLKMLNDEEAKS